jgi:tetratricopeptide (TPR) repeat protein
VNDILAELETDESRRGTRTPAASSGYSSEYRRSTVGKDITIRKRRSKLPLVIAVVLVLVVAAGSYVIVNILPEMERANAYRAAVDQMGAGDYAGAQVAFTQLNDYQDSVVNAQRCGNYIEYYSARDLYDAGAYDVALAGFKRLSDIQFIDAAQWVERCEYAQADSLYRTGRLDAAYDAFIALGDYEDATGRAAACLAPLPSSGITYLDEDFNYSECTINFNAINAKQPTLIKIYNGTTHVASVFLNEKSTATLYLPVGTYTFRQATGKHWFGDELLFGASGKYSVMLMEEGAEQLQLLYYYTYTITLNADTDNKIQELNIEPTSF